MTMSPPPEIQKAVFDQIAAHGEARVGKRLGIDPATALRVATGRPLARGTVLVVAQALGLPIPDVRPSKRIAR
jgi:hypothetical protein